VPLRLGGRDRYVTAGAVADQFSPGVSVAYVASGEGFADALAGAALAGAQHQPLVLTASASLPIATVAALNRLKPQRIVVLGGTASVSDAVKTRLASYTTGTVTRLEGNAQEGSDRYGTAAAVARTLNGGAGPTDTVYVASGQNFPDALAGAAVAGATGQPVLLTTRDRLPAATRLRLSGLQPAHIVVLGGTGSVSEAVATELAAYAPVERLGGVDRYATAALVAARLPNATTAYVANGAGFPDALAGAALAGGRGAPVLLVSKDAVPAPTADELSNLTLQSLVTLGGSGSVSPANVTSMGDRFVR
jgi:putative cell wall-binding protein